MIITTSSRVTLALEEEAQAIGASLKIEYVAREKRSMKKLQALYGDILLLTQEKLSLEYVNGTSFSFHPDTAMLRIKALRDPLLELIGEEKQTILDTTMGLASDSIVMSAAGHVVTALESQPLIHAIVARGLRTFDMGNTLIDEAMRSIQTNCMESLGFLRQQEDNSYDIIYCDPMFSEEITESDNLSGIKQLANYAKISEAFLAEAKRVARKKIILKAHFRDTVFEEFGFERIVRPNTKFHYGIIKVGVSK